MLTAARLAGFVTAQAVAAATTGATLDPILGYLTRAGRTVTRLETGELATVLADARTQLAGNAMDARAAVLLADARITVDGTTTDALLVELRDYTMPAARARIAIPYTTTAERRLRIHRPQFVEWTGVTGTTKPAAIAEFSLGIAEHADGLAAWKRSFDPAA